MLVPGLALCMASAQLVPATHDSVRWQGRTLRDGRTGAVSYAWAGVSFSFNVTTTTVATTVSMQFSSGFPDAHLEPCTGAKPACGVAGLHVYVDGVLKNSLALPMGAAPWPNNTGVTTWITLLNDFQCGAPSCAVQGIYITDPITLSWPNLPAFDRQTTHAFRVGGGGSSGGVSVAAIIPQPPVSKQQRRIDIYGDSITAGNQINPETCDHDWSGTYGKLLCEDFGANCTCQAISGKGIYHNCCDDNGVTMNEIGLNILPGNASTKMTAADYAAAGRPDGIMINLGTNDWGYVVGKTINNTAAFVKAYLAFVEELATQQGFPAVKAPCFFLVMGPILGSHNAPTYRTTMHAIIAGANANGIPTFPVDMLGIPVDRCHHPAYDSHVMMYQKARPVFASALGWQ